MNLFLSLLIIFWALSNTSFADQKKKKTDNNEVIWAIKDFSKKLENEKNIVLMMYGVSCAGADKKYDGKIHEIDVGYRIDKNMKYDEAKKLFYSVVDDLLKDLNGNNSIRHCFYHYPLTYEDLYFRLNFDYQSKGYLKRGDISAIAILGNEIMYFISEEDGTISKMEMKETVLDAYMITGFSSKTRCIRKKLPENDQSRELQEALHSFLKATVTKKMTTKVAPKNPLTERIRSFTVDVFTDS